MIPFIIDIVILVVISLFIYFGFRNGMIKSIMLFFSMIMSWIFSAGFTTIASEFIYLKLIQPYIYREFITIVSSKNITADMLSDKIPNFLLNCLSYCGITLSKLNHIISSVSKDTLPNSLTQIFMPVCIRFLKPVIAGILFLVLTFLSNLIVKLIMKIFKLKVLSFGNKLVGGIIGALKGYTVVLIVACILKILLPFIEISYNKEIISGVIPSTTILKYVYNNNPFYTIIGSI